MPKIDLTPAASSRMNCAGWTPASMPVTSSMPAGCAASRMRFGPACSTACSNEHVESRPRCGDSGRLATAAERAGFGNT